jgi:hypothetical protein
MSALAPAAVRPGRDPLFAVAASLLALLCLWPIWSQRFLPMQDYPQHLFLSFVLHSWDDPRLDWSAYRAELRVAPYSLEYWLVGGFARVVPIEAAGKLLVSLYVLGMAALVARAARRVPADRTPWALLLLFPLVFNQTYYLGFVNYLLALPLLFLALYDLEALAEGPVGPLRALRHAAWLGLLFLCHPFAALLYLGFGSVLALAGRSDAARRRRVLGALVPFALVVGAWALGLREAPSSSVHSAWALLWWPAGRVLRFLALPLTGMRLRDGVDVPSLALWSAAILLLFVCARRGSPGPRRRDPELVWVALALAGYGALPFWLGYYAFFNLRLAAVAALALVLWCAPLRVPRAAGLALAVLCAGLVAASARISDRVGDETAELLPVLAQMEPNARVLPIYVDPTGRVLERDVFPVHVHDHNYYHVRVGGGANPNLFPNPMLPVQLAPGLVLPAVDERPGAPPFAWDEYAPYYRYVLVRGARPPLHAYLAARLAVRARSGAWALYENPPTP